MSDETTNLDLPDIELSKPTVGVPGVKFQTPGDGVIVGIVDVKDYQQRKMSGEPKFWDNGDPMMGELVIGLVLASKNATIKDNNEDRPVVADDIVGFYCEGARFYTWRDAKQDHGAVNVGDIMEWKFDRTEPSKQKGFHDKKVMVAEIRSPKLDSAEEIEIKKKCVRLYHERNNQNKVVSTSTPQPSSNGDGDEDDSMFSFQNI